MHKLTKNQSGFGFVGIALVVLAVALAVGIGWYVLRDKDSPGNQSIQTSEDNKPADQIEPNQEELTKEWIAYSDKVGQFSLKYPPSWVLPSNGEGCLGNGSILIGPDEEHVGKCDSGNTKQILVKSLAGHINYARGGFTSPGYIDIAESEVTVQGVRGIRYSATSTAEALEVTLYPANTKLVLYQFYTNDRTYEARYRQEQEDPDNLEIFETIVTQTLRFSE